MARRNRKTKRAKTSSVDNIKPKTVEISEEEKEQERKFFIWTGVITVLLIILLYFLFN